MKKADIHYTQDMATFTEIAEHLHKSNNLFPVPLDTTVNIDAYAKKIRDNARTFEAWDGTELVGFLAMYENTEGNFCFVTMLSTCNVVGLGRTLIAQCIAHGKNHGFREIRSAVLEKNIQALNANIRSGFKEYDRKGDTLLMKIVLNP